MRSRGAAWQATAHGGTAIRHARRTSEGGPHARSVADVQGHQDEREQGQHRGSHGHRKQAAAACKVK